MNKKCPFFGICGGCALDFTAPDYREQKLSHIKKIIPTSDPIWIKSGLRRRADFCFSGNQFGYFEKNSKNIVTIDKCPNLCNEINNIVPLVAKLPWNGSGSCLITKCDNGIDIAITSNIPYITPEFRAAAIKLPAIRITWNDKIIAQHEKPTISFAEKSVEYPSGAFLQPSVEGADTLRNMVIQHTNNAKRIADLFCGLGNFTFALNADGFDIVGTGVKRDLFKKPLTVGMLNQYDTIVMDPPRAGAMAQCQELIHSDVKKIIYISCNPNTFLRDKQILEQGGYKTTTLVPVDQFAGSTHWEIFSVFEK